MTEEQKAAAKAARDAKAAAAKAEKEAKEVVVGIPFDFNGKRRSKSFAFDDVADGVATIEGVVNGKKNPDQRFIQIEIDERRYLIDSGDLNDTKGFHDVVDADAKERGELVLQPGARISSINNTISWRLVG